MQNNNLFSTLAFLENPAYNQNITSDRGGNMDFDFNVDIQILLNKFSDYDILYPAHMIEHIAGISTAQKPIDYSLLFFNSFKEDYVCKIQTIKNCLMLVNTNYKNYVISPASAIIFCDNPRYEYARILHFILKNNPAPNPEFQNIGGAYVSQKASIGKNTVLGPGAVIYNDVSIGNHSIIMPGAIINPKVKIGDYCIIRENAVIGGYGFGIEKDPEGNNIRIPHLGGVLIENNVEIGAVTTVASGTIEPTYIGDFVKIDDHCHIGHNDIICKNTVITAGAVIGGSTKLEENSWIGINSNIMNGISIGKNVTVGMGTNVCKSVADKEIVMPENNETMTQRLERLRTQRSKKH